ncbi:MAG TPA: hypothetical protein ENK59_05700, partial [Thioploca sp.]|nr:hypothetical protein [Thioploca sp.]
MKYFIGLISLCGVLVSQASEVDFSKAYLNNTDTPLVLNIAGIQTNTKTDFGVDTLNWILSVEFNPAKTTFRLLDAKEIQDKFNVELAQQSLRNKKWIGKYTTANNVYETELQINVVQDGFVGAEVIHYTFDEPEPANFLHAKLIGEINTQYKIDEDGLNWIDVNEYKQKLAEINVAKQDGQEVEDIPKILAIRHLMRLKRGQKIGESKHATSSWGTFNEYRLTLENDTIIGNVGKPPEKYGDKDSLIT